MLSNAISGRAGLRFRHFVPGVLVLAVGVAGIESPERSRQSEAT
jgi:hypothetical protein